MAKETGPSPFSVGGIVAQKYRLIKQLGEGAMGVVWLAVNELTGGEVALKLVVRPEPELRHRLLREAQLCCAVRHKNVIQIHDVSTTSTGDPFLVMELLSGETLADMIDRKRRLNQDEAASIARDIARALAAAHEKDIVHRDLKPANIFLHHEPGGDGYIVKVLDFGVSKNLVATDGLRTVAGGPVGSPVYMSPEQANADPTTDGRSDIWSLGVVLFEMLTGTKPFSGETMEVLKKVLTAEIPVVSRRVRKVDPALEQIVSACMQRNRELRPWPASELARQLEAFTSPGARGPMPSLSDSWASNEPVPQPPDRRPPRGAQDVGSVTPSTDTPSPKVTEPIVPSRSSDEGPRSQDAFASPQRSSWPGRHGTAQVRPAADDRRENAAPSPAPRDEAADDAATRPIQPKVVADISFKRASAEPPPAPAPPAKTPPVQALPVEGPRVLGRGGTIPILPSDAVPDNRPSRPNVTTEPIGTGASWVPSNTAQPSRATLKLESDDASRVSSADGRSSTEPTATGGDGSASKGAPLAKVGSPDEPRKKRVLWPIVGAVMAGALTLLLLGILPKLKNPATDEDAPASSTPSSVPPNNPAPPVGDVKSAEPPPTIFATAAPSAAAETATPPTPPPPANTGPTPPLIIKEVPAELNPTPTSKPVSTASAAPTNKPKGRMPKPPCKCDKFLRPWCCDPYDPRNL